MECELCGKAVEGNVCKNCGFVIDDRPIASNSLGYIPRKMDITTLYSEGGRVWEHPLSPNIRKKSQAFIPRYQKKYEDYVYVKAYESISKLCASLRLPQNIKFEALNLFKGIRKLDEDFFRYNKLAPTYLACIKIACKINDFPLSNYDLASVVDYESAIDVDNNVSYMEKKFNKSYRAILKLYDLNIKEPENPRFIDYACEKLDMPYNFTKKVHYIYSRLRETFQPHFRIEGYILAIIYLCGDGKFTLKMLENEFHTSSITISNRKNELLKYVKKV